MLCNKAVENNVLHMKILNSVSISVLAVKQPHPAIEITAPGFQVGAQAAQVLHNVVVKCVQAMTI